MTDTNTQSPGAALSTRGRAWWGAPTRVAVPALAAMLAGSAAAAAPSFDYQVPESGADTGMSIVMLRPELRLIEDRDSEMLQDEGAPDFRLLASQYRVLGMQVFPADNAKPSEYFQELFRLRYRTRMEQRLHEDIREILTARGFESAGQFDDYAEVGAATRQQAMLASAPTGSIALLREADAPTCRDNLCVEKGHLRLEGQFLYLLAEPLTGSVVAVRRMNIYGLDIEVPYVHETRQSAPSLWTRFATWVGLAPALTDTRAAALDSAMHALYQGVMGEIDGLVSRRQLVALGESIRELKK